MCVLMHYVDTNYVTYRRGETGSLERREVSCIKQVPIVQHNLQHNSH